MREGASDHGALEAQLAAWVRGIGDELRFWDSWLASRGLQWPEDYARRMDPEAPLDPRVAELAPGLARDRTLRVLDVGAGPVTMLGHRAPDGLAVEITATDPLAPHYAGLLARHGAAPPVATGFAPAEDLLLFVPAEGFDLVHCRNALDHSFDPLRGIAQMLGAARIGGAVLLSHFEDEAEREGYAGLHQWNFTLRGGRFVIWNRGISVDVAEALPCPCRIACRAADGGVEALIEKAGPAPPEPEAAPRERLAAYLEAFVRVLGATAGH
jgi:SAM-dependent methyltransferase